MTDLPALIVDVDGTLCPVKSDDAQYEDLEPYGLIVQRLRQWQADGYRIVLYTSRNMRSFDGNVGLINKHTAPKLLDWLQHWNIPFDELHFGKPWPGHDGFYVDDRAVRPDEFLKYDADELRALLADARLEGRKIQSDKT
jgi:capsule biosynthesis phosphatase